MRLPITVLAFGIALAATQPANAEDLQGDRFITALNGNTVSGTTTAGTAYNLYFLPGGTATYGDASGRRVGGHWRLDRSGDVCVTWQSETAFPTGCYRVEADGSNLAWSNKDRRSDQMLRGSVTNAFLTAH